MPIYINRTATQREAVLSLLHELDSLLPGLTAWTAAWSESDFEPANAGRKIGESLANTLAQLEKRISDQTHHIVSLREYTDRQVEAYSKMERLKSELQACQQELTLARQQVEAAQFQEQRLNEKLKLQQQLHRREVRALEIQLAEYRALNARQHSELIDLMGEAYNPNQPPAQLPG